MHGIVVISAGFGESGAEGRARQPSWSTCAADGHAPDRPELHGRHQHRPRVQAQRHVRAGLPARGPHRVPVAVRRARHRRDRAGRAARARDVLVRLGRATRPTSRATISSATGSEDGAPRSCCSTSSRSGTRDGSDASCAASAAQADRRGEERPERGRAAGGVVAHGALLAASSTRRSTRCCDRSASSAPTRSRRCSTSRRCSRTSRCRRRPRRDRDERRRTRHPVRRHVRGARPVGSRARAETVAELASFLPGRPRVSNPVDMIASATAEDYGRAIRMVAADPSSTR